MVSINGIQARTSKPNIKQSNLITLARRRSSRSSFAEDLNTHDIVISRGKTNKIIVATEGAMTLGNNRQSCMYTLPSAKNAAMISNKTNTISASRSGPMDNNFCIGPRFQKIKRPKLSYRKNHLPEKFYHKSFKIVVQITKPLLYQLGCLIHEKCIFAICPTLSCTVGHQTVDGGSKRGRERRAANY